MAENNIFILDDGTRPFIITNTLGDEICTLHVRSGDYNLVQRYRDFASSFDDIIAPLKDIKLDNNGDVDIENNAELDDALKTIKGVENKIINEINKLFGMNDAEKLFSTRSAFATVGGVFFAEKVIEMLGNIVGNMVQEENEITKKRIDKYTKDIDRKNSTKRNTK